MAVLTMDNHAVLAVNRYLHKSLPLWGEGFRERGIELIANRLLSHESSQDPLPRPLPLRGGGEINHKLMNWEYTHAC